MELMLASLENGKMDPLAGLLSYKLKYHTIMITRMAFSLLKTPSSLNPLHLMTSTTSMMDGSTSIMRYSMTQLELKELSHLPLPKPKKFLSQ